MDLKTECAGCLCIDAVLRKRIIVYNKRNMELEKTKNTINGFISGIFSQAVNTILPFALRTAMIYSIGIEYAGINSLFTSILSVLSLADLGFASAVVFAMYKPIKENDNEKLCQLLGYYQRIFQYVGLIIFAGGLAVMPFLRYIIKSDVPGHLNLYVLYLGFLINTVITYFFGGYRTSILYAHQRKDIHNIVVTVVNFFGYILQVVLMLVFKQYYLYLAVMIGMNLTVTLCSAAVAKRMFPNIQPKPGLDKESRTDIFRKVTDLLYQRVGETVSTSLDSVVISRFLGFTALAMYGNYFYVFSAARSFMDAFFSSLTAGVGNKILTASKEENKTVFYRLMSVSAYLVMFCCACLAGMYQPFMNLWMGSVYMYPASIVALFVLYFFVNGARRIVMIYKDALGMWHYDRWKSIVGAAVNLFFNITLVQIMGVGGVIISTIISYLAVEMPWETHVLYKHYFQQPETEFYHRYVKNLIVTALVCLSVYYAASAVSFDSALLSFLFSTAVTISLTILMIFVIYHKNEDFRFLLGKLKSHFFRK